MKMNMNTTGEKDALIEKKLSALEAVLKDVPDVLSPEEIAIIRDRAESLLYNDPLINGMRGLINKIIGQKETNDIKEKTKQIQNHINELNLAYLFSKQKNFAIGIERSSRENNKKIDITIYDKKNCHVEVKNINEPEYARGRHSGKSTAGFEYQLEKSKALKDNKNLRLELFIKESLIKHIKDTEEKFLNAEPDSLNILTIPLGQWGQLYMVEDLQSWYFYNRPPESHPDPLFRLYDFYARDIGFQKRMNIHAFVALEGKGLADKYKISFFAKNGDNIKDLENIFLQ